LIYKKSWKYLLYKDDSYWCYRLNLYRIKALRDFSNVTKGDLGGFVQGYHNLSQEGNCWIYDSSRVSELAKIIDNAIVINNSMISGNTIITGNHRVKNRII
jgi:NDP-sugar pyrophosphorylase family protein